MGILEFFRGVFDMNKALILLLAAMILPAASPYDLNLIATTNSNINGLPMADPQGLAVNTKGEEFVIADTRNDRIIVVDTLGKEVFSFPVGGERHTPFGVVVDSMGQIIVSPMDASELWVFDYNGQYYDTIILPDKFAPGRMSIDKNDYIYVIDRSGKGIIVIDHSGRIIKRFDSADNQCKPSGVTFDRTGNVIMTSAGGDAITIFSPSGEILRKFGQHGEQVSEFSHPTSSLVDNNGMLWVVDSFRHQLILFDDNYKFADIIGMKGSKTGEFFYPVDLKITPGGKLGVLEKGTGRLDIFRVKNVK